MSAVEIHEENPNEVIGSPMSVLDSMHKKETKDGDCYFDVEVDDWDEEGESEDPLSWSLDEPSNFCDW